MVAGMARPLRIEMAGGWYHVTARGNERKRVFRDDKDRVRFLELLEEWVERFGMRLHGYVLMENHYHLLVETTRPNLGAAMQWLQVSYTVGFNRRHRRVGHLFQGRYKAIVTEAGAAWELSQYVHLNPVRVGALGLEKAARRLEAAGMGAKAEAALVRERLARLRGYRWSSYRVYAGLAEAPGWLTTEELLAPSGGKSSRARARVYREEVEAAVRSGWAESPWERLEGQVVLGTAEFVGRMRRLAAGEGGEQPQRKWLRARPGWESVVAAVEGVKGEKWERFRDRSGDWGRDMALLVARRRCGLTLRELAGKVGGVGYAAVQVAVRRLAERVGREKEMQKFMAEVMKQMSYVET